MALGELDIFRGRWVIFGQALAIGHSAGQSAGHSAGHSAGGAKNNFRKVKFSVPGGPLVAMCTATFIMTLDDMVSLRWLIE